ncbi:MAG TPA: DUF2272 domain-containing protein [Burkholderiaceae bacterium]
MRRLAILLLSILHPVLAQAVGPSCAAPGPVSERGERLARIALSEYARFNGHRIDAQGRLWKFGSVETETEPLLNPDAGKPEAQDPERFAWRRVWRYWQTLDQHVPGTLAHRRISWVPGLLDAPDAGSRPRATTLEKAFAELPMTAEGASSELQREALVRAALSDNAWSAAFISFLMHEAELPDAAFRYSSAHAVYIRPALEGQVDYAYRACDPRRTQPRVGDLICYSRGENALADFRDWQAHASELGGGSKSHCDLVVSVDKGAAKLESIGGNVLQSVTRRKLMLNEQGTLSDRHQLARHPIKPGSECGRDATCTKSDLNLQRWGVLLQLR